MVEKHDCGFRDNVEYSRIHTYTMYIAHTIDKAYEYLLID